MTTPASSYKMSGMLTTSPKLYIYCLIAVLCGYSYALGAETFTLQDAVKLVELGKTRLAEDSEAIADVEQLIAQIKAKEAHFEASPNDAQFETDTGIKGKAEMLAMAAGVLETETTRLLQLKELQAKHQTAYSEALGYLETLKKSAVEQGAENIRKRENDMQTVTGTYAFPSIITVDKVTHQARVPVSLNYKKGEDGYCQDNFRITSDDPKVPVSGEGAITISKADPDTGTKTASLLMSAAGSTTATIRIRTHDGTASYGQRDYTVTIVVP